MRRIEQAWRETCGDLLATLVLIQILLLGLAVMFAGSLYLLHCLGVIGQG